MKKHTSGFTLVELMVTIAVIAIMAAIAFPSMRDFVASARIANRAEQIGNLFRFAKSEAVRLGKPVIICGTQIRDDGRSLGVCDDKQLNSGLMAYADNNRNGVFDTGVDAELRTITINAGSKNNLKLGTANYQMALNGAITPIMPAAPEFIFMSSGAFGTKPNTGNLTGLQVQNRFVAFQLYDNLQYSKARNFRGRVVYITPTGVVNTCRDQVTRPSTAGTNSSQNAIIAAVCNLPTNS